MARLLDKIEQPSDLKRLSNRQLGQLAAEIREELVSTVTANGGHLASNLGVVELTIALHRVFDSPRDKIIWDVGHQSYIHKLLTGRKERFASLRKYGGLSGFTDRAESIHDPFGGGHASTSVSAATGMAIARDLCGDDYGVIAVIGDGALTGGMAFEALNHAGHLGTELIVILNDNGMAISPSVGALSRLLSRVRLDPRYHRAMEEAQQVISSFPLGSLIWQRAKQVRNSLKKLIMTTTIWEELGFTYVGPINGHNIAELEKTFSRAREYRGKPIFIHVITTKGKGYHSAERDATKFHGLPPNGGNADKRSTYSEVFARCVLHMMEENPRVVAVTAAMTEGTGLTLVAGRFPGRVFDVGICEQHLVTLAAGLSTQGLIPIAAVYSTFLQRAFDQIIHDVCLQDLPVVFAIDRGGIVGEDGKTHQGSFDISYLTLAPNLIVAAPKDENELQNMLYTAVNAKRPMAIRYPRGVGLGVPLDQTFHEIPIGKGEVIRQGRDVAILAIGSTVAPALKAAEMLADLGIEATVVNARFAKPLDTTLILEVTGEIRRVVTVEENALIGGFGSSVLDAIHDADITDVRVGRIGIPDEFVEQGSQAMLRSRYNLDAEGIVHRTLAFFPEIAPKEKVDAR